MSIYGRFFDLEPGKYPLDTFCAALRRWGSSLMTDTELAAAVERMSGYPLTTAELAEVTELKNTVTGSPANKLSRANDINDIMRLAEARVAGYDTPSNLRVKLGLTP